MKKNSRQALILDLDGTLLHLEETIDAIVVPGRTRPSFLALETIENLFSLSRSFDLVLATGRSWQGTKIVVEGLNDRKVLLFGMVMEDGGMLGKPGEHLPLEPRREWDALRKKLDCRLEKNWPAFLWQEDFKACLVARCESREEAVILMPRIFNAANAIDSSLRCHRDGRKIYLSGKNSDKWTALQKLLGTHASAAVGIGDGLNDRCWLSQIKLPCTLQGSEKEIVEMVKARGGFLSERSGHGGIDELLGKIALNMRLHRR